MKHLFVWLSFLLLATPVFSQNSAVTNAILLHKDQELDKAKENIDKAIEDEKTKSESKTWYYRGLIYADIYKSTNASFKALSANPLGVAGESFLKAKELDQNKGEYYKLSDQKLNELWGEAINVGVADYENSKYSEAISAYELAQKIKPSDTTAFVYGMYAAEEMGRNDLISKYGEALIAQNHKSSYIYVKLVQVARTSKDYPKALEVANKGLGDFPGDAGLLFERAQVYLATANNKGALEDLLSLSKLYPQKKEYLLYIGSLYEKENDDEKALDYYNKVLTLDPQNVTANFNIGSLWYSKGKEVLDRVNANQSIHAHHTSGKETEKEGKDYLLKAYDYAEAAYNASKEEGDKNDSQSLMNKINKALNRKAPENQSLHK